MRYAQTNPTSSHCYCIRPSRNECDATIERIATRDFAPPLPPGDMDWDQLGKVVYTCFILMLFAGIILVILVRSMRLDRPGVEVETVLFEMRRRVYEEKNQADRRRLWKAKQKVVKWMSIRRRKKKNRPKKLALIGRLDSVDTARRATVGYLPSIVVTGSLQEHPSDEYEAEVHRQDSIESMAWSSGTQSPTKSIKSPGSVRSIQFDFNITTDYSGEDSGDGSREFLAVPDWRPGSVMSQIEKVETRQRVRRSSKSFPNFPTDEAEIDSTSPLMTPQLKTTPVFHY